MASTAHSKTTTSLVRFESLFLTEVVAGVEAEELLLWSIFSLFPSAIVVSQEGLKKHVYATHSGSGYLTHTVRQSDSEWRDARLACPDGCHKP